VKRLAFPLLLLLAAPAWAADTPEPPKPPPCPPGECKVETAPAPTVELPAEKKVAVGERFSIAPVVTAGGTPRIWLPDKGLIEDRTYVDLLPQDVRDRLSGWVFYAQSPGTYRIGAYCGGANKTCSPIAVCTVTVGDPPPGPTPGPTPPGPAPPGPAPIPGDGFRVLMVYESAELSKLPPSQQAVLYSNEVRNYLNSHCVKGPDGKTAEFRIWDQNVNTAAESKTWQDAMARPRKLVPWLIVSNPQKGGGWEGPLPSTVADAMKILTQFGG
jgi:hypothetical protein